MTTTLVQNMGAPEKFPPMEALWQGFSKTDSGMGSIAWHGEVLAGRDRLTDSGKESFVDWEAAKARLREELQ